MRGKKAKAIRKIVYNGSDIRVKEYHEGHEPQMMVATGKKVNEVVIFRPNPTVICVGMRRVYQQLKAMIQTIGRKPTIMEAYQQIQ